MEGERTCVGMDGYIWRRWVEEGVGGVGVDLIGLACGTASDKLVDEGDHVK